MVKDGLLSSPGEAASGGRTKVTPCGGKPFPGGTEQNREGRRVWGGHGEQAWCPGWVGGVWSLLWEGETRASPPPHLPVGLWGLCRWVVHRELSREPSRVKSSPPPSENRVVPFCSRKGCPRGGSGQRAGEKGRGCGKR